MRRIHSIFQNAPLREFRRRGDQPGIRQFSRTDILRQIFQNFTLCVFCQCARPPGKLIAAVPRGTQQPASSKGNRATVGCLLARIGNKRKWQEVDAIEEGERSHPFIDKAVAIFDGITDGTLMILKGHLLLEELLYAAVLSKCPNPAYLENSQLRFFQLLRLVRSLYLGPPPEQTEPFNEAAFWDALDALNTLRNRLAHKLEPKDLSVLL